MAQPELTIWPASNLAEVRADWRGLQAEWDREHRRVQMNALHFAPPRPSRADTLSALFCQAVLMLAAVVALGHALRAFTRWVMP